MVFFMLVAVLVLGIIGAIKLDSYDHSFLYVISVIAICFAGLSVLISSIYFACVYTTVDAKVAENKQIYESLTYQYENNVFDDDDDVVGKKELYNQIQDWNQDLAYYQNVQDNFWIGIYYPNVFDQFEFIELS